MNEEAISYIMQKMSNCLDNSQMISLRKTFEYQLSGVSKATVDNVRRNLSSFWRKTC